MPFLSHIAEAKHEAAHLFLKYFDSIHSKLQQESITHLSAKTHNTTNSLILPPFRLGYYKSFLVGRRKKKV